MVHNDLKDQNGSENQNGSERSECLSKISLVLKIQNLSRSPEYSPEIETAPNGPKSSQHPAQPFSPPHRTAFAFFSRNLISACVIGRTRNPIARSATARTTSEIRCLDTGADDSYSVFGIPTSCDLVIRMRVAPVLEARGVVVCERAS